ncbi:MAG TPA: phosphoglucosamine mutase, partial [Planctomycetota bacterium]|nr:phosphoglucosamine mutase [Planctomycetota bacterium]
VAIVDETGTSIGEEAGLALCTRFVLSRANCTDRPVVINMSTSRMTEDVALEAGYEVIRTPAGEVNVAEKMKDVSAIFGGEGNGGIIDPRIHCGRDSIVGIGLALEAMARSGHSMRKLASTLPQYHMVKTKIDCPPSKGRSLIRALRSVTDGAKVDTRDGLRLDWEDAWVQLRASNTEPILRIIAEARTEERARELVEEYTAKLSSQQDVLQAVS